MPPFITPSAAFSIRPALPHCCRVGSANCAGTAADPAVLMLRCPAAMARRLRAAVRWVDWQEAAPIEFGRWNARLQERGTPIEDMDLAIASVALGLPARLATLNIRHFARIDVLELVDWSAPHPDPEERA